MHSSHVPFCTGKIHWRNTREQLSLVGPRSLGVALLTAAFVGMVFTIQVHLSSHFLGLSPHDSSPFADVDLSAKFCHSLAMSHMTCEGISGKDHDAAGIPQGRDGPRVAVLTDRAVR